MAEKRGEAVLIKKKYCFFLRKYNFLTSDGEEYQKEISAE